MNPAPWRIVGQGLAGTCLAWHLWDLNVPFTITDRAHGGSSRVAAGLINPITGKNFEPSWRIANFLPEAISFYQNISAKLGQSFWHPHPILRLAATPAEWEKIQSKRHLPLAAPWIDRDHPTPPDAHAAILLRGGGRLDTLAFLNASRDFFQHLKIYQIGEIHPHDPDPRIIRCEGATGLLENRLGPHRCAKGEILTIRHPLLDPTHIRIGHGGWIIPIGNQTFKAGATYDWNNLDETPTPQGAQKVLEILQKHGIRTPEVIDHQAGIRPILRRSEPLIGPHPDGGWAFNALGSKGSLYAPGVARQLTTWLLQNQEPDPDLNLTRFLSNHAW